ARGTIYRAILETTDDGNRAAEAEMKESMETFKKLFSDFKVLVPSAAQEVDGLTQDFEKAMAQSCNKVLRSALDAQTTVTTAEMAAEMGRNCAP
ncbi:hypothetical protein ABTM81_19130, partial [Acinetobacter baumannii]